MLLEEFSPEQRAAIEREMERLRGADDAALLALNEDSVKRRAAWFEQNREHFTFLSEDLLESGYRLLLERFRISPEEAPVVSRTDRSITFHSLNFCPTLEACHIFGLDTRHVCKRINEDSTNVLLRQIDPRLRFSRNYEKLRPYAPYCEEYITLGDG
ncbi:MAG: hypothetical protein LLF75_02745 [Eubacteriales bacterium]|nr:hypothetical protein [Eubacteriales bacterium]